MQSNPSPTPSQESRSAPCNFFDLAKQDPKLSIFHKTKTANFSNRKSNSSIFHVKYNISGMPTLQFPYFPASFRHADSTVSLFSTHRFDDFPSFQHVGSFKPYSVVPRTPKNMPFACMRANYTYFKRRKKRNASCLRTRMQIACFPSMLE